jgi:nucleoside-diphosphate-sugar epimerase
MRSVLIAGANGFVGQNLVEAFAETGCNTTLLVRNTPLDAPARLKHHLPVIVADLTRRDQVANIDFGSFDTVINLAGIAINDPNEPKPTALIENNVACQTNVAEEIISQGATKTRLIAIGSGAIFVQNGSPITESSQIKDEKDATAYVASKIRMRDQLLEYTDQIDMALVHSFNHAGIYQRLGFLVSDWTHRLQTWDGASSLDTSRLSSQVNMLHVKDVVDAYIRLSTTNEIDGVPEFVVGSRKSQVAYVIVELIAKELGMRLPQTVLGPSQSVSVSTGHLFDNTGWTQRHTIEEAVKEHVSWASSVAH